MFKKAYQRGFNDPNYKDIISRIRAVVFLSTPHRGSDLAKTLSTIVSLWSSHKAFIKELSRDSFTLEEINDNFRNYTSGLELYSFYERKKTSLGSFKKEMIVGSDSSSLGYPGEHAIPLDADHHTICKFSNPNDPNYRSVVTVLKTLVDKSREAAQQRNVLEASNCLREIEKLLSITFSPEEDYSVLEDHLTPGTCESLLGNSKFQSWVGAPQSSKILWLYGPPGSGKSVKSAFVIKHLKDSGRECQYFFFKHDDVAKRSSGGLLRSIAFQAARGIPAFREALGATSQTQKPYHSMDGRQLWFNLFEPMLFKLQFEKPLFWVIDALDEADSATALISSFSKIPANVQIRILLTSRETPAISTALDRLRLDIEVQKICIPDNHDDIQMYLRQEATFMRGSPDFQQALVTNIARRAEGNFLWASLAMQECLESHSREEVEQILEDIPSGMEALYQRMESIVAGLAKTSDQTLARIIITWVTYAKRPLHKDELIHVLRPTFSSLYDIAASINQVCGHFVKVDTSDRVTLIHKTAREYLMQTSSLPFTLEPSAAHEELFLTSLQTLSDPQWRSKLGQRKLSMFSSYASTSWAYHLGRAPPGSDKVLSELIKFLEGPFVLSWIEALALSKQLKDVVHASGMLASFNQRRRKADSDKSPLLHRIADLGLVASWALDLLKLIRNFSGHLIQDPSAIYHVIPQLCPSNTIIHKQFSSSLLSQISVHGLSTAGWDDLLTRVLLNSSARASQVVCSSKHVAISTSQKVIEIYDATTFQHLRSFHHGEHISRIALNGSGDILASYGSRHTRVWRTETGEQMQAIPNSQDSRALELSFKSDDSLLVNCTNIRKLQAITLADAGKGWQETHTQVFEDDSTVEDSVRSSPTAVRLNGEATMLAVAYRGAPLEAWDMNTGHLVRRCKRKRRGGARVQQLWTGVNRIVWHSPAGYLLGIYTDGSIFKWQPITEEHEEISAISFGAPSELQLSPDGATFVTSDVKGTIRLYSFEDFSCLYILSSEDVITGLSFTADSRRFLDIRGPYCNVWEPNALSRMYNVDEPGVETGIDARSMGVVSFAASEARADSPALLVHLTPRPQGQRPTLICSADAEGTVVLYDVKNNERLQVGLSVRAEIDALSWSPDGRHLVCEDRRGTLAMHAVEEQIHQGGSFTWKLAPVMRISTVLDPSKPRQLLISNDSSLLLLVDGNAARIYSMPSGEVTATHDFPPADFRLWSQHPKLDDHILAVKREEITECVWRAEGLQPIKKWKLKSRPAAQNSTKGPSTESTVEKVVISPSREHLLLISSRLSTRARAGSDPLVRFVRSADLDPATDTVQAFRLPVHIERLIERPLTLLGRNCFVFIDTAFWICSWTLELFSAPGTVDRSGAAHPHVDAVSASNQDVERLRVTRHFFLPRDWVNANSLALCTVLDDGTFLCPRKGEVAVIESGLGTHW